MTLPGDYTNHPVPIRIRARMSALQPTERSAGAAMKVGFRGPNLAVPERAREGLESAHLARCGAFRRSSPFLNPQPALSLVGGNRSSCPEALRQLAEDPESSHEQRHVNLQRLGVAAAVT